MATDPRFMVMRKVAAVWVPFTMWHEVQSWEHLPKAAAVGFTRDQALKVIESNRRHMGKYHPGARYKLMPMDDFLRDELQGPW